MDTTANIADVDMGRTVQRVPPSLPPPSGRSACLSSNPDAIKWSNRAGVRKFDDEVGEKEEAVESEPEGEGEGEREKGE